MFKITIEAATMTELATSAIAFAAQFQTTPAVEPKPATTRKRTAKDDDAGKTEAEAPNATTLDASKGTPEADAGLSSGDTAADQDGSSTSTTATTDASPSDGPSRDEVLKAAMTYGQAQGDDALKAKITALGATKFSEIPAEKYADFLASLNASGGSLLE